MKRAITFIVLLLTLSLFGSPEVLEAQTRPAFKPEMPDFKFSDKNVENERWMSLFVEGDKAGSIHQTVSKVRYDDDMCYLFEEEIKIRFKGAGGLARRSITRRALTTKKYLLIAFEMIDNTPEIKIGDSTGLKIVHSGVCRMKSPVPGRSVVDRIFLTREVNGKKSTLSVAGGDSEGLRPDFAAVEIYRASEMRRGRAEKKSVEIFDTTNLAKNVTTLEYKPNVKIKYAGGDREMGEITFRGESYYLDESSRVKAVRSLAYPITMRPASGRKQAEQVEGSDNDYLVDEALNGDEYRNKQIGVYLRRPHDDWALRMHFSDRYLSYVMLQGVVDPNRVFCWIIRSIPQGVAAQDVPQFLNSIIRVEAFMASGITSKNLALGTARTIADGAGGLKRYAGTAILKDGKIKYKGKYYYFIRDDRAMAALCLVPEEIFDKTQEALIERFANSVNLTKVDPLPAVEFKSRKIGVSVKSLNPSWSLAENKDGDIDVKNAWFAIVGNISRMRRPQGVDDKTITQGMMSEFSRQGYKTISTRYIKIDGVRAMQATVGLKFFGIRARMSVILVLGGRYLYRIHLGTPEEIFEKASPEIERFIAAIKLE